jgi:hypothetical protein
MVAEGHVNKQIAATLNLSIKTVEKHRQQLMDKLDVHDIAGLTRYAIAHGVVECPGRIRTRPRSRRSRPGGALRSGRAPAGGARSSLGGAARAWCQRERPAAPHVARPPISEKLMPLRVAPSRPTARARTLS